MALVLLLLLVGYSLLRQRHDYAAYRDNDTTGPRHAHRAPGVRRVRHKPGSSPIEPAYQYPGIPTGWSLDRYVNDGHQQVRIFLAQQARHRTDATDTLHDHDA